ncbi:hypothetical protein [Poriferisphaera sp. WC338]|uniref:hypothetical protein n=1 Tax=Poriferisphaera sp. WC338 TaxID=3425129 RepID=UPI003D81B217
MGQINRDVTLDEPVLEQANISARVNEKAALPDVGGRVVSIDVLRGFIIIMMLFVNTVVSVSGSKWWMGHLPAGHMGMALADFVFGSFLFITGTSIPFAFKKRLAHEPAGKLLWHIGLRVVSLIIIGHFMSIASLSHLRYFSSIENGGFGWHRGWWLLIVFGSIFMIWHSVKVKRNWAKMVSVGVRLVGVGGLAFAWWCYTVKDWQGNVGVYFGTSWYGIVGLIGWAYLIAAICYLLYRDNRVALISAILMLFNVFIVMKAGKAGVRPLTAVYISVVALIVMGYTLRALRDAWVDGKKKQAGWLLPSMFGLMGALVVVFVVYVVLMAWKVCGAGNDGVYAGVFRMPWIVYPLVMVTVGLGAVGFFLKIGLQEKEDVLKKGFMFLMAAGVIGFEIWSVMKLYETGWMGTWFSMQDGKVWGLTPMFSEHGGKLMLASFSTHTTSTMMGLLLGLVIMDHKKYPNPTDKVTTVMTYALVFVIAAFLSAQFYGIHKNGAMPAYSLICAAFCMVMWVVFYLWVDVKGCKKWTVLFKPAGANPLTVYLIVVPIGAAMSIVDSWTLPEGYLATLNAFNRGTFYWFGTVYDWSGYQPWIGVVKCLVWAFGISAFVGLLARCNFRLKL